MGLYNKDIALTADSAFNAAKGLLDQMIDDESEIVTIILGEDTSLDDGQQLADYVESTYDLECEIINGQQAVYSYILSVE